MWPSRWSPPTRPGFGIGFSWEMRSRLFEHAVIPLGRRAENGVGYRHHRIGGDQANLVGCGWPRRIQVVFELQTIGFAWGGVPGELDRRVRNRARKEQRLLDAHEIYVLLAVKSSAVSDAGGIIERNHSDVIANLLLLRRRPANPRVEGRTDGVVGRPGQAAIERIAVVE